MPPVRLLGPPLILSRLPGPWERLPGRGVLPEVTPSGFTVRPFSSKYRYQCIYIFDGCFTLYYKVGNGILNLKEEL